MKLRLRQLLISLLLLPLVLTSVSFLATQKADAITGADWKPGRIIDDAVFFNKYSMSVAQIQDFLNAKVPVCAKNHTDYSPTYPGPYTCLKDYQENITTGESNVGRYNPDGSPYQVPGGKTAAQIIWDAAQAYTINPQTLIVMLQKEQSLITDDWPLIIQYQKAMGQSCPDTAPCDPAFAGFYRQVSGAAWQIRHYINNPTWFNYRAGVTRYVLYSPDANCGGTNVYIENNATAALYNYTPYQPNAGALSNLYGTAPCGAYGNRNFWRLFNGWFGSTIGPDYAWEIADYSYAGGDSFIPQGETETITLRARNIGRVPWYNHGDCPVRLGTWTSGRSSALANNTWLSSSKITTVQESVVLPNEIGTFTFQITPNQLGTFIEGLNIVAENCTWLPWAGLSPTITVTGARSWQIVDTIYGSGTGYMEPGSTQLITVKARNTGNSTWSKFGSAPVRLGTWQPGRTSAVANGWLSPTRIDMNDETVAPGGIANFQFYVRVPSSGIFYERFNLVQEGQAWFNDPGLTLYLQGKTYSWQPVWYSPSTGNWSIPRNTTFTITIRAKNTGTMTWTKNGSFPVRLGTDPPGRGTALEANTWLNSIRPTGLVEDSVAPGAEGTFTFQAKTPNVVGKRYEAFNLVAEGLQWFQNPGFAMYINVL